MKKQSCFTVNSRERYIDFVTDCINVGVNIDETQWSFYPRAFAFCVDWDEATCRNDTDWKIRTGEIVSYSHDSFLREYGDSTLRVRSDIAKWVQRYNLSGSSLWLSGSKLCSNKTSSFVVIAKDEGPIDESILNTLQTLGCNITGNTQ